eukprot:CAMPEP_0172792018 /NCGR_PEP_ID=MMETSP1074-20121228/208764_1 /TAXON_ID=2916 /ORGANISM="Ceratium fusus, Strain PA161109" /LENGTH=39 /DNA_ID= /DNA_START= /DNA_END= /DNA_ORIENTATION=
MARRQQEASPRQRARHESSGPQPRPPARGGEVEAVHSSP